MGSPPPTVTRTIGRYALFEELAAGGMATVHIGRLRGTAGFKRTVAIKRLHAAYARDPEFVAMFLSEAQLAARIQHPNVVSVVDVVAEAGELFMVMEYIAGESLASLLKIARTKNLLPRPGVAAQILTGVLYGLHAAHEAQSDRGAPLAIVHRDVSPHNVLVGADGVARVLDFGVAKAAQTVQETTKEGVVKGKVAYMPPEQLTGEVELDRRVDIYAAGVVLWETLAGRRLHQGTELGTIVTSIVTKDAPPPSSVVPGVPRGLDTIVLKALAREREERFATALEMAHAIENIIPPVPPREVAEWVRSVAGEQLDQRAKIVRETESVSLPPSADERASVHDIIEEARRLSSPDSPRPERTDDASSAATQVLIDGSAKARPGTRSMSLLLGALVFSVVVVVAGAVYVTMARSPTAATTPVATSSSPPSTSMPPLPEATTTATVSAVASAEIGEAPSSMDAGRPDASSSSRPKRKCDPPWTVDARGVRVIKRECL